MCVFLRIYLIKDGRPAARGLHAALFHMLCFLYQQPSSVVMLRLATRNNNFVERITTMRVTSGGIHLPGFAPDQHSFEIRRNIAAVTTLCRI